MILGFSWALEPLNMDRRERVLNILKSWAMGLCWASTWGRLYRTVKASKFCWRSQEPADPWGSTLREYQAQRSCVELPCRISPRFGLRFGCPLSFTLNIREKITFQNPISFNRITVTNCSKLDYLKQQINYLTVMEAEVWNGISRATLPSENPFHAFS